MKEVPDRLQQMQMFIQKQNDCDAFRENTPAEIGLMIQQEARELIESLIETTSYTGIIEETGDVLYLALRMCEAMELDPFELTLNTITKNQKHQEEGRYERMLRPNI